MAKLKTTTILLALAASCWTLPSANATSSLPGAATDARQHVGIQIAHKCPVCGYRMVYKRVKWWGRWVRVWWCPDDC